MYGQYLLHFSEFKGLLGRSDPTENDSVEGLRPNARGPGLVTFGVSTVHKPFTIIQLDVFIYIFLQFVDLKLHYSTEWDLCRELAPYDFPLVVFYTISMISFQLWCMLGGSG